MQSKDKTSRNASDLARTDDLPYRVELWHDGKGEEVERVLGRAVSMQLARAIFNAAANEYPRRRIMLRKGSRIVADSLV